MKRAMKQWVFACLTLALCLLVYPMTARADKEWNGYQYTMEYGKVTITGYEGSESSLVIPSKIDGGAVIAIQGSAFVYNRSIENVTIPDSVKTIGGSAFAICENLKTVMWNNTVDTIPDSCFDGCVKLVSVGNVSKIKSVGNHAFQGTASLKTIELPAAEQLGISAFEGSGLEKIVTGKRLKTIGGMCFMGCGALAEINLQDGLEEIGDWAFARCGELPEIYFPSTLQSIGIYAFEGTKFVQVQLNTAPNVSINNRAFHDCKNLKEVYLDTKGTLGKGIFEGCENLTKVTLGSRLDQLSETLFKECESLASITIPVNITKINDEAFRGCAHLTTIYGEYGSAAETFAKSKGIRFVGTLQKLTGASVKLSKTIMLYTGKQLKPSVTVKMRGKTLTKGTDYTVSYGKNKAIGTGTVKITGKGKYTGSKTVKFTIKADTSKTYKSGKLKYKITSKNTVKVAGMVSKKTTSITIPDSVKLTGGVSYAVTEVDAKAFQQNKYLRTVTIGKSVKTVAAKSFYGCTKLTKITVKSTSLKKVGANALKGTKKNLQVVVPKKYYGKYKPLWNNKGTKIKWIKK